VCLTPLFQLSHPIKERKDKMNKDNAYVVATHRVISENDTLPNPYKYIADNKWTVTDNEKEARRVSLETAKKWVDGLSKVDGYFATYFLASEFFK
jgi:hypothetical protein